MQRRNDWPERLSAFVESRRFSPFDWGKNDCALFAADGVLAMTDVDLAADLRTYSDEAGAVALISKAGGMSGFARTLAQRVTGLARRGDIVLAVIAGRETFGLCMGGGLYAAPGADGVVFRPFADVIKVFEV
jgi:hypothetical protein